MSTASSKPFNCPTRPTKLTVPSDIWQIQLGALAGEHRCSYCLSLHPDDATARIERGDLITALARADQMRLNKFTFYFAHLSGPQAAHLCELYNEGLLKFGAADGLPWFFVTPNFMTFQPSGLATMPFVATVLSRFFPDTTPPVIGVLGGSLTGLTANLTWTAATDTESGVAGYRLYRAIGAGLPSKLGADRPVGLAASDGPLLNSTTYKYTLTAFDFAGNESVASNTLTLTTAAASGSPDKILNKSGGGGNIYTSWAALKASGITPGMLIEIQSSVGAGIDVFAESLDLSGIAGTPSLRITVRVRDNGTDRVRFRATNATLLKLLNTRYIDITGSLTIKDDSLHFGDIADWNPALFDTCYPQTLSIEGVSSDHFTVKYFTATGAKAYEASIFRESCSDYRIGPFTARGHGTNFYHKNVHASEGTYDDWGDLFVCLGERCVVVDPKTDHGGHDGLRVEADSAVVWGGLCDGYWGDKRLATPPGYTGPIMPTDGGSRASDFGNKGTANPSNQKLLVHGATLRNSGASSDTVAQPLTKVQTTRGIYRGIYLLHSKGHALHSNFSGAGAGRQMSHMHIYQCTLNGGPVWWNNTFGVNAGTQQGSYAENVVCNNILMGVINNFQNAPADNIFHYDSTGLTDGGYANSLRGTEIRNNLIDGPSANIKLEVVGSSGGVGSATITAPLTAWAGLVFGNIRTTIVFTSPGTYPLQVAAGHTVADWGAVAAGLAPALTQTTNAGINSMALTVRDGGFFYDGWGNAGELPDYIGIGANAAAAAANIVQIDTITYPTTGKPTAITLKSPVSWAFGDGVWFAGNPAIGAPQLWDNYGAAQ